MKSKEDIATSIVGYLIAIPIGAFLFKWYNYIYFTKQIGFWYCLLLAVVTMTIIHQYKLGKIIIGLVFCCSLIIQILSWANVVNIPIIK